MIPMIDFENLETLAKLATPGPWTTADNGLTLVAADGYNMAGIADCTEAEGGRPGEDHANAAFIAATGPDVVLGLIARARAMEQEVNDQVDCVLRVSQEVGRMQAEIARCREIAERDGKDYVAMKAERDELRATLAALKRFVGAA
jgi:urease alpha subunit